VTFDLNLAEQKIDALLISGLPNIRYLTGFTGSNAMLLVTGSPPVLFTDPRYQIQAAQESGAAAKLHLVRSGPLSSAVALAIARNKYRRVGFEKGRLTYEQYQLLKDELPLNVELVPVGGMVEKLRMVKRPDEIEKIRHSVLTNSKAFETAKKCIQPGVSEGEIAAEIDYQMRRHGAEGTAFDTIVAAGARSALPHAHPTAQRVTKDELVLIDMGSCQDGYASDMTRVLFLAKPKPRMGSLYRAVLEAQLAAVDAVREGVTAERVDRAARQVLTAHGLGKQFLHSTGHGLGLEIHEAPRLGKKDKTELAAGMVITIEPGAYLEGEAGVRIEDTILVTKTGCEVLTPTSKELTIL
jgi:Xaa-Pro aminopeptidase